MRWARRRQAPQEKQDQAHPRQQPVHCRPVTTSNRTLSGVVAYNEYGGYFLPRSSIQRPAAQRVMAGEVWERATLRYLTSQWQHGDLVHAGTYFGDFLPALAGACPEGARIWAFEPNPESFRCAQVTALINDCRSVELMNAGLSAAESTSTMAVRNRRGQELGGASRLVERPAGGPSASTTVQLVAVDDVVPAERDVSVIQLDVEGHEGPALQGAMSTIARCRPLLVLETVPEDDPVMLKLADLGYRPATTVNHNTVLTAGA